MPAGALTPAQTQCHTGRDHRQVCQLRDSGHAGIAALRWSSGLKPEQLVRMDFFTEAEMNRVAHGALFRNYIDDVVGGNPQQIIDRLQALIDKPRAERRALTDFQNALTSAKNLSDTAVRLRTLQDLRKRYPGHTGEIDAEISSTAQLEGARLYRAIGDFLTSLGEVQMMKGATVQYTVLCHTESRPHRWRESAPGCDVPVPR